LNPEYLTQRSACYSWPLRTVHSSIAPNFDCVQERLLNYSSMAAVQLTDAFCRHLQRAAEDETTLGHVSAAAASASGAELLHRCIVLDGIGGRRLLEADTGSSEVASVIATFGDNLPAIRAMAQPAFAHFIDATVAAAAKYQRAFGVPSSMFGCELVSRVGEQVVGRPSSAPE